VDENKESIRISIRGLHKPHILKINLLTKPEKVSRDDSILTEPKNYNFDEKTNKLIIKTLNYSEGEYLIDL